MKKNILLVVIVVLLIVLVAFIATFNTNKSKIARANILYGTSETCDIIEPMTDDVSKRICHICFHYFQGSSSQIICSKCSDITNRCTVCGKIKSNIFYNKMVKGTNYDS